MTTVKDMFGNNELSEGGHLCSEIDPRFKDISYYYEYANEIWLSLLYVKEEFRGQGVLTKFIKFMQTKGKKIIIPTPNTKVHSIVVKMGFMPEKIWEKMDNEYMDVIVWENI